MRLTGAGRGLSPCRLAGKVFGQLDQRADFLDFFHNIFPGQFFRIANFIAGSSFSESGKTLATTQTPVEPRDWRRLK